MNNGEEILLLCKCNSTEHQIIVWWDNENKEVFLSVHLSNYRNFWKRLWHAIKYVFGYKSKYGDFDEIILRDCDAEKIKKIYDKLK